MAVLAPSGASDVPASRLMPFWGPPTGSACTHPARPPQDQSLQMQNPPRKGLVLF